MTALTTCASLLLCMVIQRATPSSFELLDVESVGGRPVNRYRTLELGERPVKPVAWEAEAPAGVRYGLAIVGANADSSIAVAWDPLAEALWLDADGDRRFARSERHEIKAGAVIAVRASIRPSSETTGLPTTISRVLLLRSGLFGTGPRYTVRGAMKGTLDLGGRSLAALLIDANVDGCFNAGGRDQVWVDLDGDGGFDPATEQFPLGAPIVFGATSYTVASDAWARSVLAHQRDTRRGRLRLSLGTAVRKGAFVGLSASLVSNTGELLIVEKLDEPVEAFVGRYRIASLELQLSDETRRVWKYHFGGGRGAQIRVSPNEEARADLLKGLAFLVTASDREGVTGGNEVDATPHLRLDPGLYLTNCTTRMGQLQQEQGRSAEIVLKSSQGVTLDRAISGFL
jgi:hypothetical protein